MEHSSLAEPQLEFMKILPWEKFESILDIGAGAGFATREFLRRGKRALAVDLVKPELVPVSCWLNADAHHLPAGFSGQWDAIWCYHCLEHVLAPLTVLREFARCLKHGGYLFLVVPDCTQAVSTGHIHCFTWPSLAYNLACAGFTLKSATYHQRRSHMRVITTRIAETLDNITELRQLTDRFPLVVANQIRRTGRIRFFPVKKL